MNSNRSIDVFAVKAMGMTTNVSGRMSGRHLIGVRTTRILGWVSGSERQPLGGVFSATTTGHGSPHASRHHPHSAPASTKRRLSGTAAMWNGQVMGGVAWLVFISSVAGMTLAQVLFVKTSPTERFPLWLGARF